MNEMTMPRRSVLYLPAANARALDKARTLACDAIIFDLEDAVAPAAKADAREQLAAALQSGGYAPREVIVRVNGVATPWGEDDLRMVAAAAPDGVLFPKIDTPSDVDECIAALDRVRAEHLPIWLMIETPAGVLNAAAIATRSNRISALVLGTSDLVKELRARHTVDRANLLHAMQHVVLAARLAGIDALDGVHLDFRNLETLRQAALAARDMGYDGKTLIHPSHIDIANEVFGVEAEALAHAERVLEAWRTAAAQGSGVAELDGQLIENLHAAAAERTLQFAAAIAERNAR